jgi:hypothetical protein
MEPWWKDIDWGNQRTLRQICTSTNLSTTKPACTYLDANLALRGERVLSKILSLDTANSVSSSYVEIMWGK